jgi:hypothetical protein
MANKTLGFLKIWLAEKLGLDEEGSGFFCGDNGFCQCPCNYEKCDSGVGAGCFRQEQFVGNCMKIAQNCAKLIFEEI